MAAAKNGHHRSTKVATTFACSFTGNFFHYSQNANNWHNIASTEIKTSF